MRADEQTERSGQWFFFIISLAADTIGLLVFILGIPPSKPVRLTVAAGLCIIGVVVTGFGLIKTTTYWFSPEASYQPRSYFLKSFASSGLVLLISATMFVAFLFAARQPTPETPPVNVPVSAPPSQQ